MAISQTQIEETVLENAQGPKSVQNAKGEKVENHSPKDIVDALARVVGSTLSDPVSALRFNKIKHASTQGGC